MRVWLASGSKRRSEMLKPLFSNIICQPLHVVDEFSNAVSVPQQVLEICQKKAAAVGENLDYDLIIVSDTMLQNPEVEAHAMGKPKNNIDAAAMLHQLSGRRHKVWTATGIFYQKGWTFHLNHAIVEIDNLSDEILVELVLNNSWLGKAGGYDLAGQMGDYAKLIDGHEATVLGIAADAMKQLLHLSDPNV